MNLNLLLLFLEVALTRLVLSLFLSPPPFPSPPLPLSPPHLFVTLSLPSLTCVDLSESSSSSLCPPPPHCHVDRCSHLSSPLFLSLSFYLTHLPPSSSSTWLSIGAFDSSITNQQEVDLLDLAMIARPVCVCVCTRTLVRVCVCARYPLHQERHFSSQQRFCWTGSKSPLWLLVWLHS